MDFGLTDKVALVTGTGSQAGMGKEIALTLAREGCHVVCTDINLEGAEKTAADVRALGRQAVAIRADICRSAEVTKMAAEAVGKLGKIVSISSFGARTGVAGAVVYCSAKEGIIGLTKALAKEVGPAGINVNAIAPGLVLTEFYGPGLEKLPPQMRQRAPAGGPGPMPGPKLTSTRDVANTVAFLVSDVSANINGQTISVDGGQFMI